LSADIENEVQLKLLKDGFTNFTKAYFEWYS